MVYNMASNATGPWTGCSYDDTAKYAAGETGKVIISSKDRDILRRLAEKVAMLARDGAQKEKIKLWEDHNSLKTTRPIIFCDPENGWNEIITDNILECSGNIARRWELILRKELFWGEQLKDDKPIEAFFDIGYTYTEDTWTGNKEMITGGKGGGSYVWEAPVKSLDDIGKIKIPKIHIDHEITSKTLELAKDIFNGLLKVRLKGVWWWSLGFTIDLAKIIGLNRMLLSFYDDPELIHQVNQKITEAYLYKLEYLEKNNLLFLNNSSSYIGSGGLGHIGELPAEDFDGRHIRPEDMWGFSESQETSGVSPEMFEEFLFSYQLPIIEKFGLACYGCCEPLDKRWHIVKKIPNLRRVSVSHWADTHKMADHLQDKYIYSMKPTPADLAVPELGKEYIKNKMLKEIETTRDCVVEVLMKDNHTLGNNPDNLIDWVRIMREVIDEVHG